MKLKSLCGIIAGWDFLSGCMNVFDILKLLVEKRLKFSFVSPILYCALCKMKGIIKNYSEEKSFRSGGVFRVKTIVTINTIIKKCISR
jgi:hypothetical protein